jgi:hypothetical protein
MQYKRDNFTVRFCNAVFFNTEIALRLWTEIMADGIAMCLYTSAIP